jgi:transcriptional regulator with XRE-family HTH domain/tetratricopeptide (TPR) repeat protein
MMLPSLKVTVQRQDVGPAAAGRLGGLLRQYRQAAGLSQEELAQRCGLSSRTLSDIERGRTARPFGRSIRLVADALQLDEAARARLLSAVYASTDDGRPPAGLDRPAPAYPPGMVPRQLPAPVRHFACRAAELGALDQLLGHFLADPARPVVAAICGTAGVGKTALAVHWAQQAAGHFPDGQLYLDLRGYGPSSRPLTTTAAIRRLLESLGVQPDALPGRTQAQASLYRSLLAGRRTLVLLDNAHSPAQVRPLLPGGGCLVLVTSRAQLAGLAATQDARLVRLDPLAAPDAREFLAARLGAGQVAAAPAAVGDLIRLCAGLPLALSVAAARMAASPAVSLPEVAADLEGASRRLDALECGDPMASMRAVLSWSYRSLSPPAAGMFRLLGLHPGPDITVPAAASLAGAGRRHAEGALRELTGASVLTQTAAGRYAFHDLLRSYAAERAQRDLDEPARDAAVSRMLDHYLHTGLRAAACLVPTRDSLCLGARAPGSRPEAVPSSAAALAWFTAEHPVLLAVTALAADDGYDQHAWQLPWVLEIYFHFEGRWLDWVAAEQTAIEAATRLGDPAALAQSHASLGRAYIRLGRDRQARSHLDQAGHWYRSTGDSVELATIHLNITQVLGQEGRRRDALGHAYQALRLSRSAGHQAGQAKAMNMAGWYHALLGEFRPAIRLCGRALAIYREVSDPPHEAATWDTLGYVHHRLGRYGDAAACFQRAVDLFCDVGGRYDCAAVLARLGDARWAAGSAWAAREAWRQALGILTDLRCDDARTLRAGCGAGRPRPSADSPDPAYRDAEEPFAGERPELS